MTHFIQHNPPHPGRILLDIYMQPLNLTVTDMAARLFITRPNMSAIVNEKAGVSAAMALKLAKAFSTTPQFWMNLQNNYDLWEASKDNDVLKKVSALV